MRTFWQLVFVLAIAVHVGCVDPPPPALVTAPSSPIGPPTSIELTGPSGVGATAGHAYLAATVRDASGRGVPNVSVHFAAPGASLAATVMAAGICGTSAEHQSERQ